MDGKDNVGTDPSTAASDAARAAAARQAKGFGDSAASPDDSAAAGAPASVSSSATVERARSDVLRPGEPSVTAPPAESPAAAAATSSPANPELARARLWVLLVLTAGAAYVIALILWPFFPAIVTSAALATLVYPVYGRIERFVKPRDIAAFLTTVGIFFLVLVPLVGLSLALLDEIRARLADLGLESFSVELVLPGGPLFAWLESIGARFGLEPDQLSRAVIQRTQQAAELLASRTGDVLSGIGGGLLQAFATLFTLFYMLRDADRITSAIKRLIPLEPAQTQRVMSLAREIMFATVLGSIIVAIVQGALGGAVFWALGLPGALLWGTLMGVLALIPLIGPFIVWVPAAIILLVTGNIVKGIIMALAGAILISGVDNVLRPVLISGRVQLHPLAIFFSILGGAFAFGAVGILVGPVLFVTGLAVLEMGRLALGGGPTETPAAAPEASGLIVAPPPRPGWRSRR